METSALNEIIAIAFTNSNIGLNIKRVSGYPTNVPLLAKLADDLKRKNSTTARVDIFVSTETNYRKIKTFNY